MNLLLLSLLILTSCFIDAKPVFSSSVQENSWVSKAPMPTARADLGVAVVNGDIYAVGGNTINGENLIDQVYYQGGVLNTVEKYDSAADNWTSKAPMPTPRDSFAIAVYQNKIYCIGGRTSFPKYSLQTFTSVNEVYDPATDTWHTRAPMPTLEWPLQASVVNGKIYVIGRSGITYAYDPVTDSWATKTKAPTVNNAPIAGFATAVFTNKIYVIGISDLNLLYDPLNDTWSEVNSSQPYKFEGLIGYGSFRAVAGTTSGMLAPERIYVFFENQVYIYTSNDSWVSGTVMPEERTDFGVAVINDTFYIVGGSNSSSHSVGFSSFGPIKTNEQYFPIGYGTPDPSYVMEHTPPTISILSPLNQTYNNSSVSLIFTVDKAFNWTGYSVDGKQNITITGNDTMTNLANGLRSITVYANDTFGNMGASTINFTVAMQEPFPTTVATVSGASLVVVIVGLVIYYKKWKR